MENRCENKFCCNYYKASNGGFCCVLMDGCIALEIYKKVYPIGTATSQNTICPICHGVGYSMQKVLVASIDFGLIEHEIKQFCDSCDGKGRL